MIVSHECRPSRSANKWVCSSLTIFAVLRTYRNPFRNRGRRFGFHDDSLTAPLFDSEFIRADDQFARCGVRWAVLSAEVTRRIPGQPLCLHMLEIGRIMGECDAESLFLQRPKPAALESVCDSTEVDCQRSPWSGILWLGPSLLDLDRADEIGMVATQMYLWIT